MKKQKISKTLCLQLLSLFILLSGFLCMKIDSHAVTLPTISLDFDPTDQSVILAGCPAYDSTGTVQYELNGYLNYNDERIETFCYAPSVAPYHVPEAQAYIFNWTDTEFILPCSGEYQFTAYMKALYFAPDGTAASETGPKQTITITLNKKDESDNWGPGLPNTTVETYDLEQIKGKDKSILIEEDGYTWTINGMDIESIPEKNLPLAITKNPENLDTQSVSLFFGNTVASTFSIEYSGDFGFISILDYYLGPEYAGKYANLFYVKNDGTFEFMEGILVDEAGFASYTFTHASDYIIAVTDVEYTGQDLNPKPEEPVAEPDTQNHENSNSEGKSVSIYMNPLFYVVAVVSLLVIAFVTLTVIKKK